MCGYVALNILYNNVALQLPGNILFELGLNVFVGFLLINIAY